MGHTQTISSMNTGFKYDIINGFGMSTFLKKQNLKGQHIDNLDLVGLDLEGVDFEGAIISNVDFRSAKLSGASFRLAKLHNVILNSADLRGTDLEGAIISGSTTFYHAKLDKDTNLKDVSFARSAIIKDCFKGVYGLNLVKLQDNQEYLNCVLSEQNANRNIRELIDIYDSEYLETFLRNRDNRGACFNLVCCEGLDLSCLDFSDAVIERSVWSSVNLNGSILRRVKFTDVFLDDADLRGADLEGAKIYKDTRLKNVFLDKNTNLKHLYLDKPKRNRPFFLLGDLEEVHLESNQKYLLWERDLVRSARDRHAGQMYFPEKKFAWYQPHR